MNHNWLHTPGCNMAMKHSKTNISLCHYLPQQPHPFVLLCTCLSNNMNWIVCPADLHVQHCNDFFSLSNGAWSAISCVKSLKRLSIEDLHCRLDADSLKELATMTQVRHSFCYETLTLSDIAVVYCRLDVDSCKGVGRAEHNISEPET